MNKKAIHGRGIVIPLSLLQKPEENRDNSSEGELQPLQVATSGEQNMKNQQAQTIETTGTETVQAQPIKVDVPNPPASSQVNWDEYSKLRELEIRSAELMLRQNAQTFEQKLQQEDRSFLNRHLIPAAKFVGGVVTIFGAAALTSWLLGDGAPETTAPPVS